MGDTEVKNLKVQGKENSGTSTRAMDCVGISGLAWKDDQQTEYSYPEKKPEIRTRKVQRNPGDTDVSIRALNQRTSRSGTSRSRKLQETVASALGWQAADQKHTAHELEKRFPWSLRQ